MKKLIVTMLFFSCLGFWAKAQAPLQHEKKIYVSPEGKIYINKALPLYLRLSTSPDKQDKTYLQIQTQQEVPGLCIC